MFERFTDRARRVVVLAQDEARALGHNYIGPEHLLLGMLSEGNNMAATALTASGLSLQAARNQLKDLGPPAQFQLPDHLPFTPSCKTGIERAMPEAMALGHHYIGPEHLLLGLVRADTSDDDLPEAIFLQFLGGHDIDRRALRQLVLGLLSGAATVKDGKVQQQPQEPQQPQTSSFELLGRVVAAASGASNKQLRRALSALQSE